MNKVIKDWNDIKINDSWAIFKIIAEFVEGYERMARIGPCVSVFGSARTKPENKYYQLDTNYYHYIYLNIPMILSMAYLNHNVNSDI